MSKVHVGIAAVLLALLLLAPRLVLAGDPDREAIRMLQAENANLRASLDLATTKGSPAARPDDGLDGCRRFYAALLREAIEVKNR
jgi:hypothetical protein